MLVHFDRADCYKRASLHYRSLTQVIWDTKLFPLDTVTQSGINLILVIFNFGFLMQFSFDCDFAVWAQNCST